MNVQLSFQTDGALFAALRITFYANCNQLLHVTIQTNSVNRIANLPSFFMHLTRICDYPYQTNICKFTALLHFCPHACDL